MTEQHTNAPTNRMIRVLIADDQENIRSGFRLILDAQPDIQVIGEAADGRSALDQAKQLRPDVVLADIRMPRLDGLELTRLLAGPGIAAPLRVVVVTTFDLDEYVHAALRNGACGFLLKRSGPTLLTEAVRAAMSGDTLISPQVTVRLLRQLSGGQPGSAPTSATGSNPNAGPRPPLEPPTARELDVARLVARGLTNAEIGERLFISAGTVKTHLAAIGRKLDVRNRVEIAAWAWETGHAQSDDSTG